MVKLKNKPKNILNLDVVSRDFVNSL